MPFPTFLTWGLCLSLVVVPSLPVRADAPASKAAKAVKVIVDPVRQVPLDESIPVLGRIVALRDGKIASEVGGIVRTIQAEVGDRVQVGAPLLQIDPEPFSLKLDIARAEEAAKAARLNEARAVARITHSELQRLEKLKSSAAFTQARYDDKRHEVTRTQAAAEAAEADFRIATANRKLAERDLSQTTITAPFDAIVTERLATIGAYISKGASVYTLMGDRSIEIEAEVPASALDAGAMAPKRPISVTLGPQWTATAHIRAILPRENPRTRTQVVRLTLAEAPLGQSLVANHPVEIAFPSGQNRPLLSVAKDAVIRRNDQTLVMVAANNTAEARPVTLGQSIGSRFEVITGLESGDLAVVRGNERLQPGTPLRYETPQP